MSKQLTITKRLLKLSRTVAKVTACVALAAAVLLLLGLYPVNSDFRPKDGGITIYLVSNSVHADIILPLTTAEHDWRPLISDTNFPRDVTQLTHVAFGWGDKGFFLETQSWSDLKLSVAANALLCPSESCIHISMLRPEYYKERVAVSISPEQYSNLIAYIESSFKLNETGQKIQIQGHSYYGTDAFFEAYGTYHMFNTCNSWIGQALQKAGVKTPAWSPLPGTPMLYLDADRPN